MGIIKNLISQFGSLKDGVNTSHGLQLYNETHYRSVPLPLSYNKIEFIIIYTN